MENTYHPKVAIIILNWNGWEDTIECLESLYQITYPNYEVIVVDNGSEDESVEKIKEYCEGKIEVESKFFECNPSNKPIYVVEYEKEQAEKGGDLREEKYMSKLESDRKIRLVKNEKNYGFAEGNNIGMRYALITLNSEYILLLNNDTVVDRDFLIELVRTAEENRLVGAAGPKIYFYDFNGRSDIIMSVGGYLSSWNVIKMDLVPKEGSKKKDNEQFNKRKGVKLLNGECLLLRKNLLADISWFDPKFFLYKEEFDLLLRASKRGYKLIRVPKAKIWHKGGSSGGNTVGTYYQTRNWFLLSKKNSNNIQFFTFCISFFVFFWIRFAILLIRGESLDVVKALFKGTMDGVKLIFEL